MALVDGWKIDDALLPESVMKPVSAPVLDTGLEVTAVVVAEDDYRNPLEALAAYLPERDKIKPCKIIGRTYCKTERVEHMDKSTGTAAATM